MFRLIDTIASDLSEAVKTFLTGVLCLCGLVALAALSVLVAGVILLQPETGLSYFSEIMSFKVNGLIEPVRQFIMVFNWLSLAAMALLALRGSVNYLRGAARRSSKGILVQFPERKPNGNGLGNVVNF